MTRHDSIRAMGLKKWVDEWCMSHNLPWRYKHLADWVESGDQFGEKVPALKLARLFKTSRPTMEKWLIIYNEEKKQERNNGHI